MSIVLVTRIFALVGIGIGILGILFRLGSIMNRPFKQDLARAQGSSTRGVLYAFTLGMAPWEKESTAIHWIAYLRGILFHVGIFLAAAVLIASPWLNLLPGWITWTAAVITGASALLDLAGIFMRLRDPNLRVLSLPDDFAAILITSAFTGLACATLIWPAVLPAFYVLTGLMAAYIPFSKIRHCVYFFYAKFFFGMGYGHRGVIGQPEGKYAE